MTFLTDDILTAVVRSLSGTFDSHDVIQALMTRYPQQYVRELYKNVETSDPIRITHSAIGRTLLRISGIAASGKDTSVNVRGPETENETWQKTGA